MKRSSNYSTIFGRLSRVKHTAREAQTSASNNWNTSTAAQNGQKTQFSVSKKHQELTSSGLYCLLHSQPIKLFSPSGFTKGSDYCTVLQFKF